MANYMTVAQNYSNKVGIASSGSSISGVDNKTYQRIFKAEWDKLNDNGVTIEAKPKRLLRPQE